MMMITAIAAITATAITAVLWPASFEPSSSPPSAPSVEVERVELNAFILVDGRATENRHLGLFRILQNEGGLRIFYFLVFSS